MKPLLNIVRFAMWDQPLVRGRKEPKIRTLPYFPRNRAGTIVPEAKYFAIYYVPWWYPMYTQCFLVLSLRILVYGDYTPVLYYGKIHLVATRVLWVFSVPTGCLYPQCSCSV